ncbi:hypothetical protein [Bradyrhizobium sp. BRP56]|uniref:hypothetical protein n=1 Tax=Bradyrhizobium sp. BRP56 TaxID=2793819 RepID=UPI001CD1B87E|nr:hypothetical protein [Bradyrhizobium sp. BRP56]MCA1399093.1 hypothetical protein [Bradyrhizobium sp. BRP56]
MTTKALSSDEIRARGQKRLEYRMIAEPEGTDEPTPDLLTTDVIDWFMLRAPRVKFELCSLKIAILQGMDQGRAQSGEYTIYCGGGIAVVCSGKSALLLLGYERIRELLRYLDYELEQASRSAWDDLVVTSLTPAQTSQATTNSTEPRKARKSPKVRPPAPTA